MNLQAYSRWVGLLAFCVLTISGCGTTPSAKFYTLSPLNAAQTENPARPVDLPIGIGPVSFPEFLDRPQIVARTSSNQLEVDEFHRWGGSLQEDFSRVLVQNLSALLDTNRVHVYPSQEQLDLSYRVAIDVQQFDGRFGEGVTLNAVWTLLDEQKIEPLLVKRFQFTAPTPASDYEALVAAHSEALAALSQDIAAEMVRFAP
ncbi:MAG: PqiC family protein [Candidatus Competibacteraceae bacterium]|jgi:uncharacterized lipoprotein YmbA|nr:PqiC family protein [Candidatus Competibacteraceae bacterium]